MSNCKRMMKMQSLPVLLTLLLFLCLVHPCNGENGLEVVAVFEGNRTAVPFTENDGSITIRTPRFFRIPAFVGGMLNNREFLAVMCDARYVSYWDWSFIEPAIKTSYGDYKTWSAADIFVQNTRKSPTHSIVGDVTAVMKENKIFVLAPSWDKSEGPWFRQPPNTGWDIFLVIGTVVNSLESGSGDTSIKWERKKSLKDMLPKTVLGAKGFQFIGGVGNGVVTKSGTIIFPIQLANTKKEAASSIMYSTDDGDTWHIDGTTEKSVTECSVAEWGEGKFILNSRYDHGYRKVFESDDMGATWKENLMFSRVWGNDLKRKEVGCQGSAITAPVDGEDVLFFSHPLNKGGFFFRDTLLLWMSDGQRIVCVGTISRVGKEERSGYAILLHVGDSLYVTQEVNAFTFLDDRQFDHLLQKWDRTIGLSPLPQFFESAKKTVRAWRELDKMLQSKSVPTNGLVGYLGNSDSDSVWADMYSCVNGTVKNGERVDGGFRFTAAPGSGAQWPVISQGQNQVYMFTRQQFTLSATAIIHATSGAEEISLLGASADAKGNAVLLGLGYTKDKKWYAMFGNGENITAEHSLKEGEEYHVAITFAHGVAAMFVDGVDIADGQIKIPGEASISHFYMGGMGKSSAAMGSSCTVKNAMLFNRALEQKEIDGLSKVKKDGDLDELMPTTEIGGKVGNAFEGMKNNDESDNAERSGWVSRAGSGFGGVMPSPFVLWMCLAFSALVFTVR